MGKIIFFGFLLVFVCTEAYANEEPLKILSYEVDPIPVLDENARLIEKRNVKALPRPDVEVQATNEELDIVMIKDADGKDIWIDTFDVKLNHGKVVNLDCYKLIKANPKDAQEAGTMGFGSKCNKQPEN